MAKLKNKCTNSYCILTRLQSILGKQYEDIHNKPYKFFGSAACTSKYYSKKPDMSYFNRKIRRVMGIYDESHNLQLLESCID